MIKKQYRPELNGLRAIAVILVLLFHLDFPWMNGGFLGVDVFLVISGYFISRNILSDLELKTFSFPQFYKKRMRRLFPAMFFTIAITLIAGCFLLTPLDLQELGESSIYSALSVSNIHFWSESGYFDSESLSKPLLHMWSLSLEEQFYLFWPVLLFLVFKLKKRFLLFFSLAFIGSISLAIQANNLYPEAAFFLLPFRVFEFALGASCVLIEPYFSRKKNLNFFSLIGICLLFLSVTVLNDHIPLPWFNALIACIGTMMIILNAQNVFFNKFLSNRLFALIGKISYSIYLIHWPLIVFYKYWTLTELNLLEQVCLGVSSTLMAFLMWKYIENPFRKHNPQKKDTVLIWVPIAIGLFFLSYWSIKENQGFPERFPELTGFLSKEKLEKEKARYWVNTSAKIKEIKSERNDKNIIIMGNSHANDLAYAFINNGLNASITFLETSSHCHNFGTPNKESYANECGQLKTKNLSYDGWKNIDAIYLHDNWKILDLNNLNSFLNEIRSRSEAPIYIFGPKLTFTVPALKIIHSSRSKSPNDINNYSKKYSKLKKRKYFNAELKRFLTTDYYQKQSIYYIDILTLQCGINYGNCNLVSPSNSELLYFDKEHFTEQGSTMFGKKLKEAHPYLFE